MIQSKKKTLTKKVKKRPAPKVISFKDYVVDAIVALNNNINAVKIDQARLERKFEDFEAWIPKFREMRDTVLGKPEKKIQRSVQENNVSEKI